jgi:hypothetical protein
MGKEMSSGWDTDVHKVNVITARLSMGLRELEASRELERVFGPLRL